MIIQKHAPRPGSKATEFWLLKGLEEANQSVCSSSPSVASSHDTVGVRNTTHTNRTPTRLLTDRKRLEQQSLPLGPGPSQKQMYFVTWGKSPLMSLHLDQFHLHRDAGMDMLVSRMELEPPTPRPNNVTHADFIQQSKLKADERRKGFTEKYRQDVAESRQFQMQQSKKLQEMNKKLEYLLADKREVHRLSNLLVLEMQKDPSSIVHVGARQAVEKALLAKTI